MYIIDIRYIYIYIMSQSRKCDTTYIINIYHLADKGPYTQSFGFSCSHVQMWELDHKEGWAPKKWCFQIVVLEKLLRVLWMARRSNLSIPKEINPNEYSLEELMLNLWPPDAKSWLIGKDPDAGKDWGQEEKRATEDEMVGWQLQLNGHEFEQTLGDSEGQGSLESTVCGVTKSQTQLSDWTTTVSPAVGNKKRKTWFLTLKNF